MWRPNFPKYLAFHLFISLSTVFIFWSSWTPWLFLYRVRSERIEKLELEALENFDVGIWGWNFPYLNNSRISLSIASVDSVHIYQLHFLKTRSLILYAFRSMFLLPFRLPTKILYFIPFFFQAYQSCTHLILLDWFLITKFDKNFARCAISSSPVLLPVLTVPTVLPMQAV
jgi:hypothetical protein